MKKEKNINENFLEKIPVRSSLLNWSADEDGMITLEIENTGVFNRIAQKLFRRPKFSYVHLDNTGSFIWPLIDGEKDILKLGELLKEEFGEKAEPLYPRLAKFFQILESYHFISFR